MAFELATGDYLFEPHSGIQEICENHNNSSFNFYLLYYIIVTFFPRQSLKRFSFRVKLCESSDFACQVFSYRQLSWSFEIFHVTNIVWFTIFTTLKSYLKQDKIALHPNTFE